MDTPEQVQSHYREETLSFLGRAERRIGRMVLYADAAISGIASILAGAEAVAGNGTIALNIVENTAARGAGIAVMGGLMMWIGSTTERSAVSSHGAESPERVEYPPNRHLDI